MKAVIMAGGKGTRLKPLTCNIPKPLALLCGKPAATYILELLRKHDFKEAVFTLGYRGNDIIDYYQNQPVTGLDISFSNEDEPLGTAGSVKKACPVAEELLIISGDALCDFNLSEALRFHREKNADATIIVKKVSDPREYGLVLTDSKGKITSFLEKPSFESCITDLANTGVYILSKKVLELIPQNTNLDFAQDIFPLLLKNNIPVYAFEEKGYWCDIGDISSYLSCQKDILMGKVDCEINGHLTLSGNISSTSEDFKNAKIIPPCYIGKNVKISSGVTIDCNSVICDNVTIMKNAKIHGSVILNGAYIGENVTCNEAVICENARLLHSCAVYEGGVCGASSVIGENSVVEPGVKLWAGKQLEKDTNASYDLKYGGKKRLYIDDNGICGETNGEITPEVAAKLGASLGSIGKKITVGYSGDNASKAISYAVISGALSTGADVYVTENCSEPLLHFTMTKANADAGCFIDAKITTRLKVCSKDGLPLTRKEERSIEGGLNRSEYSKAGFLSFGTITDLSSFETLYINHLKSLCPTALQGLKVEVISSNKKIEEIGKKVFNDINDIHGKKLLFHIGYDGKGASAYISDIGYIFNEKLILLCSQGMFKRGLDIALPYSSPAVTDLIAKRYGCNVLRYYSCPVNNTDAAARELAAEIRFGRDALELISSLLGNMAEVKTDIYTMLEELPSFTSVNRFISISKPPSEILKKFCKENVSLSEGIVADDDEDRVLIKPVKSGRGVMMFVESYKAETAAEICDFYEKKLGDNFS